MIAGVRGYNREVQPEDRRAVAVGDDIGGYVIDGELGRGGMGIVYAATHPVIGKRAAIKVLKPSLSDNPATVERFVQEARSVNQIGHPNIVDIFAFGTLPDGRSYLVMDLLEGESLRARIKRGPLHVREAANVIDEIASALIAAHDKGFVHRDLKPDNVFLVAHPGRSDIRLLDWGLAKLVAQPIGERAYRTATGAQIGTPDYMSPEQVRAGEVDGRSDIWALGVLAFECLYGRRPRRNADGSFVLSKPPEQLLADLPFVPNDLAQLIGAMLAHAPEDRPTLAAVRALIKRIRPSLPSMSVVGLELAAAPPQPAPDSLDLSLTASKVGARPIFPTPPTGAPSLQAAAQAPALRAAPLHAATRLGVPPPPVAPAGAPRVRPTPTQSPATSAAGSAALSRTGGRDSRLWLGIAVVLVVGAAIALAVAALT